MTPDELHAEFVALSRKILDESVSNEDAVAALEAFEARTDIPEEWRRSAVSAAQMTMEARAPGHIGGGQGGER